jgi:hypothetical protein
MGEGPGQQGAASAGAQGWDRCQCGMCHVVHCTEVTEHRTGANSLQKTRTPPPPTTPLHGQCMVYKGARSGQRTQDSGWRGGGQQKGATPRIPRCTRACHETRIATRCCPNRAQTPTHIDAHPAPSLSIQVENKQRECRECREGAHEEREHTSLPRPHCPRQKHGEFN